MTTSMTSRISRIGGDPANAGENGDDVIDQNIATATCDTWIRLMPATSAGTLTRISARCGGGGSRRQPVDRRPGDDRTFVVQ